MSELAKITPRGALRAVEEFCILQVNLLECAIPTDFNLGKKDALLSLLKALPTLMERANIKPNKGIRSHCKSLSENI